MASTTAQRMPLPARAPGITDSGAEPDIPAVLLRAPCHLEVLIPALDEARRLPHTLMRTIQYLEAQPYSSSIVVIDNGSVDQTADLVARTWSEWVPVHLTGCAQRGKGAAVRRGILPLPFDRRPAPGQVFGPLRGTAPPRLAGRVGVVATGGSGAMASLVGVAKALEDSGTEVSVYSVCSGSALFGFPLGVGMSPEEVAELIAAVRPGDYIDVGWREMAALVPTLARGWSGILRGDRIEAFYRGHFGDLTLAQMRTPTYAPIWNVEHNRLEFVGPRTYPDMPVAHAIRMAVSMPLLIRPVVLDGLSWCDGGIVDIFPVRPVLDIEPAIDTAVAVNCFYPHEFEGEDVTGWDGRPLSIISAASQVRNCQHAELAREHLARLRRAARTLLVEPVPYGKVAGTGFYEQFLDTREWPEFMRAGRAAMLACLRRQAPGAAAQTGLDNVDPRAGGQSKRRGSSSR